MQKSGQIWRPKGEPERVKVHDFVVSTQGKAISYGVYDLTRNEGWVSIGIDHDTAHFAVFLLLFSSAKRAHSPTAAQPKDKTS